MYGQQNIKKKKGRFTWLQQSLFSDFWRNTGHITHVVHIDRTVTVSDTPATISHVQPTFKMKYPYL
jgi:hypothetical protein